MRWTGALLVGYAALVAGLATTQSAWLWPVLALGVVLWLIDLALTYRGVIAVGEAFWPDALRSLDGALMAALLFGLPVALTIWLATGPILAMRALLFVIMALAIASQSLAATLQRGLDRFAFGRQPALQTQRAELRAVAESLPKAATALPPTDLSEEEFVRLTRRALSHYGDLPRLAASPLTQLPVIDARLAQRQADDGTLARAAELKRLLLEAIYHLRPGAENGFHASDAWRHYNALYYPYVLGLKPYSRRTVSTGLDGESQQALHWLRSQVPERTLHNWQNAAARLVAYYLRERSASASQTASATHTLAS
ncbi:MAG TPA: hypothetical protein PKE45_11585 [Caldilineaceae bacterium]|nr:hypothetical protein [Caldilineaceae bacterium]